ncbi:hypothetical protein [Nostoc sp. UHCC 0251]|nr:hypothetical protein [Nostoc sp. UHCC 0251]MEA5622390.1 hypothetical protein [Nostoc sp. UHCC 0251]
MSGIVRDAQADQAVLAVVRSLCGIDTQSQELKTLAVEHRQFI